MPELPEVETIRLGLQKYLVKHVIENIEIRLPKIFTGEVKNIKGAKIKEVRRFGKGLVIDLDNNHSIAIHIKMTGQLIYKRTATNAADTKVSWEKVGKLPGQFTHVIFKLDNRAKLFYNDMRQFGWIKILKTENLKQLPFFRDLGPEPLNNLTMQQFKTIVHSSRGLIKPLLMDQKKIAGIGNIYANDALFLAGIDPRRKANSLSEIEQEKLFKEIENVLKKGLEVGGSSEWSYVNALGEEGGYQKIFKTYGRKGKKCLRCEAIIEKITLGGRGTFYCPKCQN